MSNEETSEFQLCLFPTKLVWQEFPQDIRGQISQLLGVMCIEIIEELQTVEQETHDEP